MNPISISESQTANLLQNDKRHASCSITPDPQLRVGQKTTVNFCIHFFLFYFIETGFIVLASVCLARPLPLKLRFSDSKIKGGFTVIFIVWHSLAVFAGGYITINAFSREWSVQSEKIIPGTTDRVSTINSRLIDRTSHSVSKHASSTFRLAFLASLSLMALAQLAPGTISTTAIASLTTVQVTRNSGNNLLAASSTRATLIIKQGKFGLAQFRLKLPANTLMSLPPSNGSYRTLEYDTDIIKFHHNCRWEAPSLNNETYPYISAVGKIWYSYNQLILGGQDQERIGMLHDKHMMGCSDNTTFFQALVSVPLPSSTSIP